MEKPTPRSTVRKSPTSAKLGPPTSSSCVLSPYSPFMRKWDILMLLLLLFTAIVTPFEVAFLQSGFDALFVINRLVDFGFLSDMILNFFLAYPSEEGLVWKQNKIVWKYASTWFFIDLISILPFDFAGLVLDSSSISQLRILRVVRLLRLIKLLRILRSARIIRRLQTSFGISFIIFTLLKLLSSVLMVVHWQACLWNIVPALEGDAETWTRATGSFLWAAGHQYLAALEFSLQILPMGYDSFGPRTFVERAVAIFCMLFGGAVYAYVIGDICEVVSNRDLPTTEFRQNMDMLNNYTKEVGFSHELSMNLREYFLHCRDLFRQRYYMQLLSIMSPSLRGEVAHFTNSQWIAKVPFFNSENKDERSAFVTAVALALTPEAFPPDELLFRVGDSVDRMYIINKGLCGHAGRVVSSDSRKNFFGEDLVATIILKKVRRQSTARALTYLDCQTLSGTSLKKILQEGDFHSTRHLIRRAAIRIALRRTIVAIAQQFRDSAGWERSTPEELRAWREKMIKNIRLAESKGETPSAQTSREAWNEEDGGTGGTLQGEAVQPTAVGTGGAGERTPQNRSDVLDWWDRKEAKRRELDAVLNGTYSKLEQEEIIKKACDPVAVAVAAAEKALREDTRLDEITGRMGDLEQQVTQIVANWERRSHRVEVSQETLYLSLQQIGVDLKTLPPISRIASPHEFPASDAGGLSFLEDLDPSLAQELHDLSK